MKRIIIIFILFSTAACLHAEVMVNDYFSVEGLAFGGNKRYIGRENAASISDHSLVYSMIYLNIMPIKGFKATLIMEVEKPSTCAGYDSYLDMRQKIRLIYEGKLFKNKGWPDILNPDVRIQAFDFKNYKVGQGLTYDQFDGDGVECEFRWKEGIKAGIGQKAAVYMGNDDLWTFYIDALDELARITWIRTLSGQVGSDILSMSSKIKIDEKLSVVGECAIGFSAGQIYELYPSYDIIDSCVGYAYMGGLDFGFEREERKLAAGVYFRNYSKYFNLPYYAYLDRIYQEKDRYYNTADNWFNYLLYGQEISGLYFKLTGETEFIDKNFRLCADMEHITYIVEGNEVDTVTIYDFSFKYSPIEYSNLVLSLSNKKLGSGYKYIYKPYLNPLNLHDYLIKEDYMYMWLKAEIIL